MAAADTEIHSFLSNTIYSSLPLLVEEMSVIMRHGSFSFGRYADDSISWEKRTVFSYDRRQEELEKLKALGIVAQKKAYFDEFFKNVGLVKASPANQQQTNQSGPSQDTKDGAKEEGNDTDAAVVEKERKLRNANQIQIPDSLGILNNREPSCQEAKYCSAENNDATIKEGTNMVPLENSFEEASVSHPPLPEGNLRCVEQKCIASGKVKQTTNRTTQHGTVLKDKGNTVSAIKNKAKVQHITKDVGIKSKPNPSLCREASVKVNKSVILGKENTPNAVRSISRQITGSRSSLPRLYGPSKRGGLVSSSSSGPSKRGSLVSSSSSSSSSTGIRRTEAKPFSNRTKQETELPVQIPSAKVARLVSFSSICSIIKTEAKPNLKRTTQEKGLPVQIPSAQVTRLVSSSSSSSIRKTQAKASLKGTRQEKELPVKISRTRVTRLVSSSSSSSSSTSNTEVKPSSKRTNHRTELPVQIPSTQVTRSVSSSSSSRTSKTEAKPSSKRTNQEKELPEQISSAQVRRLALSSASSSIKKTEVKPSLKRTKQETELPEKICNAQVTRLVSSSSSSSIKKTEVKPSSKGTNKETEFPVQIPNAQVTSLVSSSSSSSSSIINTEDKSYLKRTNQETKLPVQIPSDQETRLVSSSSSCIRKTEATTCSDRTNLRILCTQVTRVVSSSSKSIITNTEAKSGTKRTDQETELPVQIPSAQVTMPVSSAISSSIRKAKANPSSNSGRSRTKPKTSALLSKSSKSVSKNIAQTDGIGVEQIQTCNKKQKVEQRKDKALQVGLIRDAKQTSTRLSCSDKSSVQKLVNKIESLEYAKLKFDQTTKRQKKPC